MNSEQKTCQNCKREFVIEPEDFAFYEKIKVPPPTWCPQCRMQRRMAWRNERGLHQRSCDRCKKSVIGIYPSDSPFTVYCQSCWWSDEAWDPSSFGRAYDPSRSFLEQFRELQLKVPRQHTNNYSESTMVNSEYTNCSGEDKNCYLAIATAYSEDCLYTHWVTSSKACVDCVYADKSEYCYDCLDIDQCYRVLYAQSCVGCRDSSFLFDCRNTSDSIACVGLRNKRYYIFNQQYSKEEYERKKKEFALHTKEGVQKLAREFYSSDIYKHHPRKSYHGQSNKNSTGDYLSNSEDSQSCFYAKNLRGCRYGFWQYDANDCYDCLAWGEQEWGYENVTTGDKGRSLRFCNMCWGSVHDLEYCELCFSSTEDCFGSIGLRGKKFCILNKQYPEQEYRELIGTIKEDMRKRGEYGSPFPVSMSPFPYWDTVAQEHFPLKRDEVIQRGYYWREPEKRSYLVTLKSEQIPASIHETEDDILKATIACKHNGACDEQCVTAYKITPAELRIYRQLTIPIPDLCYQCRHASRVQKKNPLKLWHRRCMCELATHQHKGSCPDEFETSYAPDRPEIVYCESCYNSEVA